MTADTCSLCYTVVHFIGIFIGDLTDESALWLHPTLQRIDAVTVYRTLAYTILGE